MINFLERTDLGGKLKFFYYAVLPVFFCIEVFLLVKYWRIIKYELLTNDDIVDWLDRNEFGLGFFKIYKKDLIDAKHPLNKEFNIMEAKVAIKQDFVTNITKLINDNIVMNIEEYTNMIVDVYYHKETRIRCYDVTIRYYRYAKIVGDIKWLSLWLLVFSGVLTAYIRYNFWI